MVREEKMAHNCYQCGIHVQLEEYTQSSIRSIQVIDKDRAYLSKYTQWYDIPRPPNEMYCFELELMFCCQRCKTNFCRQYNKGSTTQRLSLTHDEFEVVARNYERLENTPILLAPL